MERSLVSAVLPLLCYRIHDPYPLQDEVSLVQRKDKEGKKACVTSTSVYVCGETCVHIFVMGSCVFAISRSAKSTLPVVVQHQQSETPPPDTHIHTHIDRH